MLFLTQQPVDPFPDLRMAQNLTFIELCDAFFNLPHKPFVVV